MVYRPVVTQRPKKTKISNGSYQYIFKKKKKNIGCDGLFPQKEEIMLYCCMVLWSYPYSKQIEVYNICISFYMCWCYCVNICWTCYPIPCPFISAFVSSSMGLLSSIWCHVLSTMCPVVLFLFCSLVHIYHPFGFFILMFQWLSLHQNLDVIIPFLFLFSL